ncbi:MAG TPA: outer membrane protein assembly factor BamE [Gammaproteobacteria bacterium]|nr:outer membrane protein assembly factor BamE [Gammaproteobacteria bacterium]
MRTLKSLLLLVPLLLLAACAYRPDIRQGNFLSDDTIAKVKPGMTEVQVQYVLGPAMVKDPFHPDRWDYVYYDYPPGSLPKQERHVIVFFKDGKVTRVEQKPVTPTSG